MNFLDKLSLAAIGITICAVTYDDVVKDMSDTFKELFEANASEFENISLRVKPKHSVHICEHDDIHHENCVDTLEIALGVLKEKPKLPLGYIPSQKQINCLAQNIYQESGIEPFIGKIAVSYGTIERVKDKRFPDSLCGVVWQKNQMSWTKSKKKRNKPTPPLYRTIAKDVLQGKYAPPSECPATNWYNPIDTRGSFNEMQFVKGKTVCTYTISRHTYIAYK